MTILRPLLAVPLLLTAGCDLVGGETVLAPATRVEISGLPRSDGGVAWDPPAGAPDVFFEIQNAGQSPFHTSETVPDASADTLRFDVPAFEAPSDETDLRVVVFDFDGSALASVRMASSNLFTVGDLRAATDTLELAGTSPNLRIAFVPR